MSQSPSNQDSLDMNALVTLLYGSPVDGAVAAESMDGLGGRGPSKLTKVTFKSEGKLMTMVLKQTRLPEKSKMYGLTREVDFYMRHKNETDFLAFLPQIYGAIKTDEGKKHILMECLQGGRELGCYFGSGSPLNWNRKEQLSTEMTSAQCVKLAFESIAKLHGKYWDSNDKLLSLEWLRGSDFRRGKNKEGFLAMQGYSSGIWSKIRDGEMVKAWDPFVCSLLDASFSRVSWKEFQKLWRKIPQTFVHGDFHPGNAYLCENGALKIFDWEMVGMGNGPQDLGQFVISHMDPDERRSAESNLLSTYLKCLGEGAPNYTPEQLRADYSMGGACRWLWFLPVLSNIPEFGEKEMLFFVKQVGEFCRDHCISPENVEMPRV